MRKDLQRIAVAVVCITTSVLLFSAATKGDDSCSDKSLNGSYAYSADGYTTPVAGQPPFTPIAEAGVYTFDGAGNLSTENTISVGGQIIPRTKTGTYVVSANCTGSATVAGGVTFNFAITRAEKSIRFVVTRVGVAVTGTMDKQ
jgi:hypothetical protein